VVSSLKINGCGVKDYENGVKVNGNTMPELLLKYPSVIS